MIGRVHLLTFFLLFAPPQAFAGTSCAVPPPIRIFEISIESCAPLNIDNANRLLGYKDPYDPQKTIDRMVLGSAGLVLDSLILKVRSVNRDKFGNPLRPSSWVSGKGGRQILLYKFNKGAKFKSCGDFEKRKVIGVIASAADECGGCDTGPGVGDCALKVLTASDAPERWLR